MILNLTLGEDDTGPRCCSPPVVGLVACLVACPVVGLMTCLLVWSGGGGGGAVADIAPRVPLLQQARVPPCLAIWGGRGPAPPFRGSGSCGDTTF